MSRTQCGGKGGGSSYDPQLGIAAGQSAAVAGKAENFAEEYYNNVVTPMLQQQNQASTESQGKLNQLYDLNSDQLKMARDRYVAKGVPAEDKYYSMVDQYSSADEQERQAQAAKGDLGQAFDNQKGAFMRNLSSLGIDPTSPAATSAMSDMAVKNAAIEAGAMNRARNAAKSLGMQLTSDAANFGRGGQSAVQAFGSAAQGNTTGAFGVANSALSTAATAGAGVNAGYTTAANAYGNNLDAYSKMGAADLQSKAANDPMAGVGKLVGTLGSAWIASDCRLKENFVPIGRLESGIKTYFFNYIGDPTIRYGVMAQEVLKVLPKAVRAGTGGMYEVNYAELV